MRSGTSYFNKTIFKKTVLRYWPVWASYFVIWLVALPLNGLMLLQLEAQAIPGLTGGYMQTFVQYTVPEMSDLALVLAVAFGVLSAMAVCSHLYSARSANFFGSLPVRREGLFLTHYLAGLAFLIVPNVVIFLLTLLVEAVGGVVFLPGLGFWLAVSCGECFFFYSMAVFCGMFTGHILALPAFYGIFNVLATGVCFLMNTVFQLFYYGFTSFGPWVSYAVKWLTPAWKLGDEVQGYVRWMADDVTGGSEGIMDPQGLDVVAVYAAAAVVLAAGSFLLYRARRLESAGDVVSVKCMRPVFQYGVALCAGLALGILTTAVLGGEEPTLMISIVVWAVIGYFVARMLLEKSFRVLRYWKGAAVSAGVFVLLFLVVGFDLTGFETRVPTADQVESVEFDGARLCYLGDGGDYAAYSIVDDPGFVERVILLHQTAVDQGGENPSSAGCVANTSLRVTYHLKNGGELSRSYGNIWIDPTQADQEGAAAWAVQQIYDDRDLYWGIYGFDSAENILEQKSGRVQEVCHEYEFYEGKYEDGEDYDREVKNGADYYGGADALALYEAVKEDFLAGRIGVRRVEDWDEGLRDRNSLTFSIAYPSEYSDVDSYLNIDIRVQDTAASTLAVLERLEAENAGEAEQAPTQTAVPERAPTESPTAKPVPTAEPVG